MRSKVAKEVRRYLRTKYPNLETEDPKKFDELCKQLKNEYKSYSVDQKGRIINK